MVLPFWGGKKKANGALPHFGAKRRIRYQISAQTCILADAQSCILGSIGGTSDTGTGTSLI